MSNPEADNANQSVSGDGDQSRCRVSDSNAKRPRDMVEPVQATCPQGPSEERIAGSFATEVQVYCADVMDDVVDTVDDMVDTDVKRLRESNEDEAWKRGQGNVGERRKERDRDRKGRKTRRVHGDIVDSDNTGKRRKRKKDHYLEEEVEDWHERWRRSKRKRHKHQNEDSQERRGSQKRLDKSHNLETDRRRSKRPREKHRHFDKDASSKQTLDLQREPINIKQEKTSDDDTATAPAISGVTADVRTDDNTDNISDGNSIACSTSPPPDDPDASTTHVQALADYRRRLTALLASDPLLSDLTCAVTPAEVRSLLALERGAAMAVLVSRGNKLTRVIVERTATVHDLKMALRSAVELELDRQCGSSGDGVGAHGQLSWRHVWRSYWLSHAGRQLTDDSAQLMQLGLTNHSEVCFVKRIRRKRGQVLKKGGQIQDD